MNRSIVAQDAVSQLASPQVLRIEAGEFGRDKGHHASHVAGIVMDGLSDFISLSSLQMVVS